MYTYNLAKVLRNRGHEVIIYTRESGYFDKKIMEEDNCYDEIKVKTVYFNSGNRRFRFLRDFHLDFYNSTLDDHFNNFLDEIKPDILHIQHLAGLSASFIRIAKKRGIPIVLTLHDYWFMCSRIQLLTPRSKICSGPLNGFKCSRCLEPTLSPMAIWGLYPLHSSLFLFRTLFLRRMLNKVDLVIAPSNFLRNKFIQFGVAEKRIMFSDNGIESRNIKPSSRNEMRRFAFIGSIMPHKGIHVLIEAFNRLNSRTAELMIYGDPSYAPSYYERLTKMATNSRIRFMGSFENGRVYDILSKIDVLVIPSIWYENSPLTIHEAAIAGVPVITSNIGGMAELIERMKSGLLFRVGDPIDLSEKMKLLIDKPDLYKELVGRAEMVKTIEENGNELEGVYSKLIEK